MQRSINPDEGIAGSMFGYRVACSNRQIQSPADPASFESYVELMRQGAAGSARVAAAARILQREAHRTSLTAKAAMGALYKAGEDPFRYINIQFDKKHGPVRAEGESVALSIKGQKEFKGEFAGNQHHNPTIEEKVAEAKKKFAKKKSLLNSIRVKAKNAAKSAWNTAKKHKEVLAIGAATTIVAGSISAKIEKDKRDQLAKEAAEAADTQAREAALAKANPEIAATQSAYQSAMFPDMGAECDTAALATALVAMNRRQDAQRVASAFVSTKMQETSRLPRRKHNPASVREFL